MSQSKCTSIANLGCYFVLHSLCFVKLSKKISTGFQKKFEIPFVCRHLNNVSVHFRIKYMAFYIAKSDQPKAREIAKRALEKINFREEAERLNVYLAWFNMENACNNEEEAEKVLQFLDQLFSSP